MAAKFHFQLKIQHLTREYNKLSMGYSVTKNLDFTRCRYDTDTVLVNFNRAIEYPRPWVPDANLTIESLSVSIPDAHFTIKSVLTSSSIGARYQPYL